MSVRKDILVALDAFIERRPIKAPADQYLLAEQLRAHVARVRHTAQLRQTLMMIAADAIEGIERIDAAQLGDFRRFQRLAHDARIEQLARDTTAAE